MLPNHVARRELVAAARYPPKVTSRFPRSVCNAHSAVLMLMCGAVREREDACFCCAINHAEIIRKYYMVNRCAQHTHTCDDELAYEWRTDGHARKVIYDHNNNNDMRVRDARSIAVAAA